MEKPRKRYALAPLPLWADDSLRSLYRQAQQAIDLYEMGERVTPVPYTSEYHLHLRMAEEDVRRLENSYRPPNATKSSIGTYKPPADDF